MKSDLKKAEKDKKDKKGRFYKLFVV